MSALWELWRKLADGEPSRRVLHMPGKGWMCAAEIDSLALALAREWAALPLDGRVVEMCVPNGPEWLAVFLALQKLGAIAAAADPATPTPILEKLAKETGAAWVFRDGRLLKVSRILPRKKLDYCLAKITSGSTGSPKVLLFKAGEMIADGAAIMRSMGIGSADVNYAMIPLGHSYGLGNLLMPLLMRGVALACSSSPLPRLAAQDMRDAGVTVCPSVPQFFRALNQTELATGELGSLRLAISAGSALPAQVAVDFSARYGIRLHNFLGSSETGAIAYDVTGDASITGSFVGMPVPGVDISQGKDGRVLVSGPAVIRHGNRLRGNGGEAAFLLGDRGHLDSNGALVVSGRAVPLAKIGGRRVDPLEVERALMAVPGVSAAFVRVGSVAGSDRLFALVETALSEHRIRVTLAENLPEWKLPRRIVAMPVLPRDERGKVTRSELDRLLGYVFRT